MNGGSKRHEPVGAIFIHQMIFTYIYKIFKLYIICIDIMCVYIGRNQ